MSNEKTPKKQKRQRKTSFPSRASQTGEARIKRHHHSDDDNNHILLHSSYYSVCKQCLHAILCGVRSRWRGTRSDLAGPINQFTERIHHLNKRGATRIMGFWRQPGTPLVVGSLLFLTGCGVGAYHSKKCMDRGRWIR